LLQDIAPYALGVSRELSDPGWDRFVETTRGGTYQQSSMWARVKATVDWRCVRLTLRRDGEIVAGCQVLVRSFARVGAIAYVSRGPLVASDHPDALPTMLKVLQQLVNDEPFLYLKLQPPPDRDDMPALLRKARFTPSGLDTAPTMTTRVDLSRSSDALLAGMRSSVRRNIRQAQHRGVTVREGGDRDLSVFYDLVEVTSRRQGFTPYPRTYYQQMWRTFSEKGHARLLIAEHQGEVLSSVFLIGFGDSLVYKMGGWAGIRSGPRPNELLHWTGMQWGRDRGYRYYDLEGIDRSVGQAIIAGKSRKDLPFHGTTKFKLAFGGQVVQFPGSYDFAGQPLLRLALRWIAPRLDRLAPVAHRVLGRERAVRRGVRA
jgi:peptidoglycan pentaglycine glycine transferase (the first glycine)